MNLIVNQIDFGLIKGDESTINLRKNGQAIMIL